MSRFELNHPPFDCLTENERGQLSASCDIVYFPDDAVILAPGQAVECLYLVLKGVVRELDGDEALSRCLPQDSFDARALLAGHCNSRYVAEEEALLLTLPRRLLLELTEKNPRFGAFFYAGISEKLGLRAQRAGRAELQMLLAATVRDAGYRQPVFVAASASIRDAAGAMKQHKSKSVLVRDGERLGIFTTTDFRDIVLEGVPGDTPVGERCGYQLLTVELDDFLFNALLMMTRHNLRRLVVTEQGRALGILAQVDVLSYFSNHSHLIVQQLEQAQSLDELAACAERVTRLIRLLSGQGVRPLPLGKLVQTLNGRLFRRAWQLIAPPELAANSCLIVMGSEGRGEQILKTDQDNALLLRDGFEHAELAACCRRFSEALARFGYPPCPGKVMLSEPEWRLSASAMQTRIRHWLHEPGEAAMLQLAIFVDAEAVAGDAALLQGCLDFLRDRLQDDAGFFSRFALPLEQFHTPLGLFSHLQTRARDGRELLDLKKGGIFPLVHGLRALALEHGIAERSSQARLQALVEKGALEAALAHDVEEALSLLLQLRLEHGLARLERGEAADNLIEPEKLSALERDLLKEALSVVKRFKAQLRHHYRLGSF